MIEKLIKQKETIKAMQANENSAIKIMKMYENYKLRVEKAIEYIEKRTENIDRGQYYEDYVETYPILQILKGSDKNE